MENLRNDNFTWTLRTAEVLVQQTKQRIWRKRGASKDMGHEHRFIWESLAGIGGLHYSGYDFSLKFSPLTKGQVWASMRKRNPWESTKCGEFALNGVIFSTDLTGCSCKRKETGWETKESLPSGGGWGLNSGCCGKGSKCGYPQGTHANP